MLGVTLDFIRDLVTSKSQFRKGIARFDWDGGERQFKPSHWVWDTPSETRHDDVAAARGAPEAFGSVIEYYKHWQALLEAECDAIVAEGRIGRGVLATLEPLQSRDTVHCGGEFISTFSLSWAPPWELALRFGDVILVEYAKCDPQPVRFPEEVFIAFVTRGSPRVTASASCDKRYKGTIMTCSSIASAWRTTDDTCQGTFLSQKVKVAVIGYAGNLVRQAEALDSFALSSSYLGEDGNSCHRPLAQSLLCANTCGRPPDPVSTYDRSTTSPALAGTTWTMDESQLDRVEPSSIVHVVVPDIKEPSRQVWSVLPHVEDANDSQIKAIVTMRENLAQVLPHSHDSLDLGIVGHSCPAAATGRTDVNPGRITGSDPTRIHIVHGPPGTGKTSTISLLLGEVIAHHYRRDPDGGDKTSGGAVYAKPAAILATAPSNVAVDKMMENIMRSGIPCAVVPGEAAGEWRFAGGLFGERMLPPGTVARGASSHDGHHADHDDAKSSLKVITELVVGALAMCLEEAFKASTAGATSSYAASPCYRKGYKCPTMVRVGEPLGGWTNTASSVPFQLSLEMIANRVRAYIDSYSQYENVVLPKLRAQLAETEALLGLATGSKDKASPSACNKMPAQPGLGPDSGPSPSEGTELYEGRHRVPKVLRRIEGHIRSELQTLEAEDRALLSLQGIAPDTLDALIRRRILDEADIVFSTLAGSTSKWFREGASVESKRFDILIVDEAAQASELETLLALYPTGGRLEHDRNQFQRGDEPPIWTVKPPSLVTLVGDHMQLPPTVKATSDFARRCLQFSLFARLTNAPSDSVTTDLLCFQYRMHPAISKFISDTFYNGKVVDGHARASLKFDRRWWHAEVVGPIAFLDMARVGGGFHEKGDDASLYNCDEILVLERVARKFREVAMQMKISEPLRILVLAPYNAQVQRIEDLFRTATVQGVGPDGSANLLIDSLRALQISVDVKSIDGSQGGEADVVIISTVRAAKIHENQNRFNQLNFKPAKDLGFVGDPHRINVALSRGRYSLVVIGDAGVLSTGSPHWLSFTRYCHSLGALGDAPRRSR